MQAIVTKFLGPTNHRGARIKAKCQAGAITVPYDHAVHEPHDVAAIALRAKLGWDDGRFSKMARGSLPDGTGNCYVFVDKDDLIY
jgi:hypothetical protein